MHSLPGRLAARLALLALATGLLPALAPAAYDPSEMIAPIAAPFSMPSLQRPAFPGRVVNIVDHGAKPGGEVKNTAAFAAAIQALAEAGGGRVLVPPGVWLTGPIHLRSYIDLHLAEGAVVKFSDVMEDYLPPVFVRSGGIELYNYSPLIYARDCENIAITGPGRLDGNAAAWWDWKSRETRQSFAMGATNLPVEKRVFGTREAAIRPSFIGLVECKNILLEGFTIGGGPNWTIHPIYSENIIVRRVNVDTDGPNNDGLDPDSCRNVLIEYCTFSTGDDCVVLKSGYDQDGRRVGRPTENVVMRHCTSKRGHGGLVIGSEMSGSVRNVFMHDCDFTGTDRVLRIKSRPGRGGVVEKIWVRDVTARDLQREVVILNMDYSSDPNAPVDNFPPTFREIHVSRVAAVGAPVAIRITGLKDSPIRDITFEDMTISSTRGVIASDAKNLTFKNINLTITKGPRFELTEVTDASLNQAPLNN
jgi:polygalacturonase